MSVICGFNVDINSFTKYAKIFFRGNFTNLLEQKTKGRQFVIKSIEEKISHDGYDNFGPKSNLFDLYVVVEYVDTKETQKFQFHTEQWYTPKEIVEYELLEW